MENLQLKNTIDTLSKIVDISEGKKQEMIKNFSTMPDNEIIKELSLTAYRTLGSNPQLYDYALTLIRNINTSICPSVEEMKTMIENIYYNKIDGTMSLEENHKLITEELRKFCKLFNQYDIDYYVVGALPCFLKVKEPLFRYHDDIDIMINEKDIPKIIEIMQLEGYDFYDDRFPSLERFIEMQQNTPPHTVLAQNPNNDFHLGFFCFKREQDNSITMREYSHHLDNNGVITDVLERQTTPIETSLRYDDTPTTYMDISFKTSSIESVYSLKDYTKRPKDITDMKKLEPYISKEKLQALHQCITKQITIKNVCQETNISHKHI